MNENASAISLPETTASEWPHRLAVLLVCATFPLLWVGALVTTTKAGMAVIDYPTTNGYNMFLYPLSWWWSGPRDLFLEHGHRLFGALVGMVTIALLLILWRRDDRVWMHRMGVLALLLVILQGSFGGLRVILNSTQIAKIHGCVAPLFFAFTVALAVFTSRWWRTSQATRQASPSSSSIRLALFTAVFAYLQIVLGSQLRHIDLFASGGLFPISLVFHLVMAAVLLLHVGLLLRATLRDGALPILSRPAKALAALLLVQLALGCATWVWKYGWPPSLFGDFQFAAAWTNTAGSFSEIIIVTSHVATGSLIFVTAVVIALRSLRLSDLAASMSTTSAKKLGGTL